MAQAKQQSSVIEIESPTSTSQEVHTARSQCQPPSETPSDSAVIHYVASPPRIDVAERAEIMGSSPKPNSEVIKPEREVMKPHFTLSDWWWELLSWMMGTLSLLAMLLLLAFFHNKSVATWRSKLSINSIVSALAQTSQTSLAVSLNSGIGQLKWDWLRTRRQKRDIDTFDCASRGPLGSLGLVWKQLFGTMKLHMTTIGALATILLVAFSTFSQQAIGISERKVHSKNGARIARANNLTLNDGGKLFDYTPIIHGAIEGLFRDNISFSEIQGHCAGERCVWERYNSLAICAHTSPPATNVTFTCTVNYTDWALNETFTSTVNYTTYALNETFTSTINYTDCALDEAVDPAYNTSYLQDIARRMYDQSITFQMENPTLGISPINDSVDLYISINNEAVRGFSVKGNPPINFLKVTFEVCMHTYQTAIEGLQTETKLLHEGPALTRDPNWQWIPDQGNSILEGCGTIEDISACFDPDNIHGAGLFLIYISLAILGGSEGENSFVDQILSEIIEGKGFERIAARMKNMAVSMTNGMRRYPLSAEMIDGIVETSQPYFRVSIPWLILPISIWLCTSVFLLFTILLTKWHGVPVWKSSPLILLDCKRQDIQLESDRLVRECEKRQSAMVMLEDGRLVETR
ncbi:hypothetical protein IQ07DRAFT_84448 [Pyrenochaeta sp. DS3sAY3a]|nr:hypothetical protein IQ07DRAFT_84448 [Pyrenochaeta sp. DS3sAY3a]